MRTFRRICLQDICHPDVKEKLLERGKEYITSEERNGKVHVFARYWFWIDKNIFGGEEVFTEKLKVGNG